MALDTPCLKTPLSLTGAGYGQLCVKGKRYSAHRLSYELAFGPVPAELEVRHMCGNRKCVNPFHLKAGTSKQNAEDRDAHNTTRRGETNGNAKLTNEDVVRIRRMREAGSLLREIAQEFGISEALVSRVARRKYWRHV